LLGGTDGSPGVDREPPDTVTRSSPDVTVKHPAHVRERRGVDLGTGGHRSVVHGKVESATR